MKATAGRLRISWRVSAVAGALVLAAAGAAVAVVPQGNVIHACRNKKTFALRVIDTSVATQKCTTSETALSWHSLRWRGNWSSTVDYNQWDTVFSTTFGQSYIADREPGEGCRGDEQTRLGRDGPEGRGRRCGRHGLDGWPGPCRTARCAGRHRRDRTARRHRRDRTARRHRRNRTTRRCRRDG